MSVLGLVPLPASVRLQGAPGMALTTATTVAGPDADLMRALLATRTGTKLHRSDAKPAESATNPALSLRIGGVRAGITLAIEPGGPPESYRITVDSASATVTGADPAGLFYGIHTLVQLIRPVGDGWEIPAVAIDDAPRFAYRGVMLDVARHFHPIATVTAYIDRAASLKFNALHLHLTDDQGWRLQLHSRPALTERASATSVGGDPGGCYTQEDYRAIVAYAAERHMTVVPEIDVPGHTHAVTLAYPELCEPPVITDHIRDVVRDYGGGMPVTGEAYEGLAVGFSSLRIRDEATYAFLADVFGEVAALTPGPYVHLGGDEALGTDAEDYAYFIDRVSRMVADLGKTPVAWHEAGAAAGLAPGTIGQYWGFVEPTEGMDEKTRGFVPGGGQLILSPADAIYLDMKPDAASPLGLTWARGITTIRRAYEWDPAAVIEGVTDADILGVEAPMWTETVRTLDDIDALAFPRIGAAAEAAWSPAAWTPERQPTAGAEAGGARTWDSFRARVAVLTPLWACLGIHCVTGPEDDVPPGRATT
ncbi:family 20 glycosylhydrolase [Microbacterium sp.]|uniref:family 20 glycosylhydrolase n=1 Tax=Microbacterium sp. TaxID=51671 RepID=UPI003C75E1C2